MEMQVTSNYFERPAKQPRNMPYDYLGQIRSEKGPMEENRGYHTICFPPHPRLYTKFFGGPDGLRERKKDLLRKWDVKWTIDECVVFIIPHNQLPSVRQIVMDQVLPAARIWFLNEVEFYFAQDHATGPFSPINELESLRTILLALRSLTFFSGCDGQIWVQPLEKEVFHMIETLVRINDPIYTDDTLSKEASDPSSYELVNWAAANNIKRKLMIADVLEDGGKGLVAMEDIEIGDVVLEIPLHLVISVDHDDDDDDQIFNQVLKRSRYEEFPVNGKMLSWLIDERSKVDSKFGVYFKTLPKEFKLGLFFSSDAILATHGTPLRSGISDAKWIEMQKKLFDRVRLLNPRASLEDFNWAYGLWFSRGINAILRNGMRRRCLVPFAGFFNHSLFPHVLHCEWGTESLQFTASRPCRKGAQCYLSYGNLSGPEIVLYYGFLPKGINYSDAIKMDPDFCDPRYEDVEVNSPWRFYLARGPVQKGGDTHFPSQVLDYQRCLLIATDEVLKHCELSLQNDVTKLTLRQLLVDRLRMLNFYRDKLREKPEVLLNWDVKLALDYQEKERVILESVADACDPWDFDVTGTDACDPLEDDITDDD